MSKRSLKREKDHVGATNHTYFILSVMVVAVKPLKRPYNVGPAKITRRSVANYRRPHFRPTQGMATWVSEATTKSMYRTRDTR